MLKISAAVIFVICGVLGGNYFSRRLRKREEMLAELINGMRLFRNEIYYTRDRLEEAAAGAGASARGAAAEFFGYLREELESGREDDASRMWQIAVSRLFRAGTPLTKKDKTTLLSAGAKIGREDADSQCAYLEKAEQELAQRLEEARGETRERAGLYRTLGLSAGAALAILVF